MGWTQDEAIAFECARECITDLMAILSEKISEEESKPAPSAEHLARLEKESTDFWRERAELSVSSHAEIARIRKNYGALVREDRRRHDREAA